MHIVLLEPEIPQNAGNIARTCAVTNSVLHLIKPLGFSVEDKYLKRAGLDYWKLLDIRYYENFEDFCERNPNAKIWMASTKARHVYADVTYGENDYIMFGKESAGIPEEILMAHEAQVRYSNLVDLKLRKTLVKKVGVICNNRYEGSPKAGSVKVPVRDTEVVVNDYDKAKGAKQTSGDTTYLTVNIDHDKAVNEIIDGFDAESVPGNLVADRLDSAGYSLGLQMDSDGSVELTTAGTAFGNTTALTEKTIYANIVDARTQQSSIGVPTAGRWLLVSPDTYGLLLKSPEFIKASDLGDAVVQTGAVGKIAGYTVFEDSTLGENVEYVAGHPNWFAVIDEWAVPVHLQDLSGSGDFIGASAVQGRKVYAYKVTKGQTILVKKKAAA